MAIPAGSDVAPVGGGSRRIWAVLGDGFPSLQVWAVQEPAAVHRG